jgi:hypothetical protein
MRVAQPADNVKQAVEECERSMQSVRAAAGAHTFHALGSIVLGPASTGACRCLSPYPRDCSKRDRRGRTLGSEKADVSLPESIEASRTRDEMCARTAGHAP